MLTSSDLVSLSLSKKSALFHFPPLYVDFSYSFSNLYFKEELLQIFIARTVVNQINNVRFQMKTMEQRYV